jgi:hypothetical protein
MTHDEQLANLESRIAALEARQPSPHDTPETNPFMGRGGAASGPPEPIDQDMQRVFGYLHDGAGRRLFQPGTLADRHWAARNKAWGGIVPLPSDLQAKVDLIIEHYAADDIDATPEVIILSTHTYLVFPGIPGMDYGTPACYRYVARRFGQDLPEAVIATIDKRRKA